jgi:ubiquitin carboxyl-terminal hydrolase 1
LIIGSWNIFGLAQAGCALEACLADYTKLELLTDCICRKCSLLATHKRLAQEAERLAEAMNADPDASMSKKRRVKEAKKLETKIKLALEEGRIEDDIKGVKMDKVFSKASTKQAMIARPPPVLALHLNRSIHSGHYAAKNNIRIIFPEILDLTSFTTSGNLSTIPSIPISTPPPSIPRSTTPTPATYAIPRTIYRLSAVVCHYGQHSFGHYVCYRRKPRPLSTGTARFTPPKLADPLGCECEKCERFGPVRDDDDEALNTERTRPGYGWLRISDESVKECGIETVLQEGSGAFMLYYERVVQARPGIYPLTASPRSSEETLKPLTVGLVADANLSTASLATVGNGLVKEERKPRVLGPRIVRSVAPARGRSVSAAPSERESMFVFSREESASKSDEPPSSNGNAKPPSASIVLTAPSHATLSASLPNLSSPPATPATPPPPTLPSLEEVSLPTSSLISTYPPLAYCVQAPQPTHPGQSQMVGLRV